ncbi:MAG TPA: L-histidine N(alpha)-methyltransferase [Planctomycetota bacterium]|nr:L-histidine N(alpha)-methyltransferase [Planctomycetota bacterium]
MTGTSHEESGLAPARTRMARDIRAGLASRPRSLPCMYFYDDAGSDLFEEITRQPEYYQTRTEEALLAGLAGPLVAQLQPRELVELGSGAGRKIRLLLGAMRARGLLERCVLFDVNELYLRSSVARLSAEYPEAAVCGVGGDFQRDLARLARSPGGPRRLVLFLAGTIGNIAPAEVPAFLCRVRPLLASGDGLLVGVDVVKDRAALEAAYNDRAGVTAAFNRNILAVVNRGLGADFDLQAWEHVAVWDERHAWIEMRLRSRADQRVTIPALGLELDFRRGEELRTEISAKYTRESFAARLEGTGLRLQRWDTDPAARFALALLGPENGAA